MKKRSTVFFILSVIIIGFIAYVGSFGIDNIGGYKVYPLTEKIKKGLDLKGGVSVVEEITSSVEGNTLDRTIKLLTMRVNKLGVSETSVVSEGKNRIRIDVPGEYDTTKVIEEVAKTGKLTFKDPNGNVLLTGSDVKTAQVGVDPNAPSKAVINLQFKSSGTKKFADATEKFQGQKISIYMDDQLLTDPNVDSVIPDGKAQISGNMTMEEAQRKADIIQSGALPVTLKNVSAKVVGPTLGSNALPQSITAGLVGIGIVLLFMLLYYRVPGLIADFALILYVFLLLGTFEALQVTLTLSGIAAFLLTVGMAVDANVLIFERIKEELKSGKSIKSSIDAGFHRALSSILDSNITTIISGIVLYNLGSGSVKGFALTLIIGVVISMLTAILVTRQLVKWAANMGWFKQHWTIGTFGVYDIRREAK